MRWNSEQVHSWLKDFQILAQNKEGKIQGGPFKLTQSCGNRIRFSCVQNSPLDTWTLLVADMKFNNLPLVSTYLGRYNRSMRDFYIFAQTKRNYTILFIHKSKQLVALTLDLERLEDLLLLRTGKDSLTMEYSPEALKEYNIQETVCPVGSVNGFTIQPSQTGGRDTLYPDSDVLVVTDDGSIYRFSLNNLGSEPTQTQKFADPPETPVHYLVESSLGVTVISASSKTQDANLTRHPFSWSIKVCGQESLRSYCSVEMHNQPAPIHAMKLLLLNQTRILICLDYYHNIKYFLINSSSITEVQGPVDDYVQIVCLWNAPDEDEDDEPYFQGDWGFD